MLSETGCTPCRCFAVKRCSPAVWNFHFSFTGGAIDRIKISVVAGEENSAVIHGGGRGNAATGIELPLLCPGLRVNGVQIVIGAPEINSAVDNRWRRDHLAS